jgi:MATE family multidrug resistance protein
VARFGIVTIDAHSIALSFASLLFMAPLSVGVGLTTRVGQLLGAGEAAQARRVSFMGVQLAVGFGLISAVFVALFRHLIAAGYTADLSVQAMAADLLLFAAMFQLSDATQVVAASAIRGYKVTRPPMMIHLMAFWLIAIPVGCVLGLAPSAIPFAPARPMGAEGFWIGFVVGLTFAAILLVLFLDRLSRRRCKQARSVLHPAAG